MLLLESRAFTLLEIVFMVLIFGVILSLAAPYFSVNDKICPLKLSTQLSIAQIKIARLFSTAEFSNQKPDLKKFYEILKDLEKEGSKDCFFKFNPLNLSIFVKSQNQSTLFNISPKDLSSNPKIYCELSNPLCKKITHKSRKK